MNGCLISLADEMKIKVAIRFLSDACDGARSVDGAGFSKFDAKFGHSLASRAHLRHGWTFPQIIAAYKLAWRYRRQLAENNVELPDLPAVREYVAPKAIINVLSRMHGKE